MDPSERRRVRHLKSEKREHFSKNVRLAALKDGMRQKDMERARMEAYRKLCAEEGIVSKRLEEYDRARQEASARLDEELQRVTYDQSLTNTEKRRRKFNLKKKYAATTVTEQIQKKESSVVGPIAKAEEIAAKRQEERLQKQKEYEQRMQEKKRKIKERRHQAALYGKRTRRGQPDMASRMESLLHKIGQQ